MKLKNKKVLLFSPSFFSYEIHIKNAMERNGAQVYYYDERSVTSPFSRAILKIFPWVFNWKTKKYYSKIINKIRDVDIDYILIIRCDMVTTGVIAMLRAAFPKAKLCLHLWDSLKNVKGIRKKIGSFDYVSSFDPDDCKSDKRLHFRPLFYIDSFLENTEQEKYDLCFCGTVHSDRYYVIKTIFNLAKQNGLKTIHFLYLQSPFIYCFYKLFGKGFKTAKKRDFNFAKKTIEEISRIERESKVVLDIQHPKQTGLTIRTLEMIGAGKKIITTNKDIVRYDFYSPNNILVIERNNPKLNLDFFSSKFVPIPKKIVDKYSIEVWVNDVLGETEL